MARTSHVIRCVDSDVMAMVNFSGSSFRARKITVYRNAESIFIDDKLVVWIMNGVD
jgi:hypothetical protein